ncbi:hypothetical protein ACPPVO_54195 [Dactylosporangium sp. McL0621]|uniref:hypothetical protein n=1 Tax=Dactylosporangium sp. McL0621 TaxID=3415678 RepID=UPI003CFAFA21
MDRIADPIRLGVHPAERLEGTRDRVPPFVPRDRMPQVVAALRVGGFVLISGDSTAGKTRLALEALRQALPHWRCVDPAGPDGLAAALTAVWRERPSVLWLDDLERYLGPGGLTAATLAELLGPAGDVVVLATIRAHEREALSQRYDLDRLAGERLAARTGRDVLAAVTDEIRLDREWSDDELARAARVRYDPRISQALDGADRHGVAEQLAAGPRLLEALRDAWAVGPHTRAAALVTAAIDVRRTGYHRPFPLGRLQELHERYLQDRGGAALRPGPWQQAVQWATQPLYGASSLLEPAAGGGYLAFDYLVDAAENDPGTTAVPEFTWLAVLDHAEPDDLVDVVWQASIAGLPEVAGPAFDRALSAKAYLAAAGIAHALGEAGRDDDAVAGLEAVVAAARQDAAISPQDLLSMQWVLAWHLGEKIGGRGQPARAQQVLRAAIRDAEASLGAEHVGLLRARQLLARQVGALGDPDAALALATDATARLRTQVGPHDRDLLSARFEVAIWTRRVHGAAAGAAAFEQLAAEGETIDPTPWGLLADCYWNLADCRLDTDEPAAARDAAQRAVAAAVKTAGLAHAWTLPLRVTLVDAVGAAGDAGHAGELAAELLADALAVVGPTHPDTQDARAATERWPRRV